MRSLFRRKTKEKKDKKGLVREYVEAIATALVLALIIRAYVVQAFKIPSGSMKNTLLIGDHILVSKFIFGIDKPFSDGKMFVFSEPQRQDIVVFKYPSDPDRDFIKRIVAVGGDVVEGKDKVLYVNGSRVEESFIQHTDTIIRSRTLDPRDNFGPITVPEDKVFVMGDNRDQSYDSRFWGFVDLDYIKGKAMIIYWSWDSVKRFPRFGRIGKAVHDD